MLWHADAHNILLVYTHREKEREKCTQTQLHLPLFIIRKVEFEGRQGSSWFSDLEHKYAVLYRSCLLVQDACGMFGEVHLDGSLWKNTELEGRSCIMAGMKVLQKVTRGR